MSDRDESWESRRSRYQPYHTAVIEGDPSASLDLIIELVQVAPDDHYLCAIGVILIDPLLDLHWQEIGDRFAAEMERVDNLRKAFSCTMIDVPDEVYSRLHALVRSEDDIGRNPRSRGR